MLARFGVLGSAAALAAVAAAGLLATQQGANAAGGAEPAQASLWRLSVNGVGVANSSACSGFGSRSDVVEFRQGDEGATQTVRKIPGALRATDVTCAFGLNAPRALYDWRRQVENGDIDDAREDATLDLMSNDGSVVQSWTLHSAWPSQYLAGPDRTILVLTHEGAVRQP